MLPPEAMVSSGPGLLPRALSGSVALSQMSMTPVTTKDSEGRAAELIPPLTSCSTRENWLCPLPTAALRRVGPAPHLGSTIELTPLVGVHVSGPRRCESGRTSPTVCLSCRGIDEGEMPPCPSQVEKLVPGSRESES